MNKHARPYAVCQADGVAYSDACDESKGCLNEVAVKHGENYRRRNNCKLIAVFSQRLHDHASYREFFNEGRDNGD